MSGPSGRPPNLTARPFGHEYQPPRQHRGAGARPRRHRARGTRSVQRVRCLGIIIRLRSRRSSWFTSTLIAVTALLASGRPAELQPQQYPTYACGSLDAASETCVFIPEYLGLPVEPKLIDISASSPEGVQITSAIAADESGTIRSTATGAGTATIELACPEGLGSGGTVAVAFGLRGSVSATLAFSAGQVRSSTLSVTFAYPPPLPPGGLPGGPTVTFGAGWNLLGGPTAWNLYGGPGNTPLPGPFYAYQATDGGYQLVPGGTPPVGAALPAGAGAWVFLPVRTTLTLTSYGARSLAIPIPPEQWVTLANPGDAEVTVAGADVVYAYDPSGGYSQTTTLSPGQGAWAWSRSGGTALLTSHTVPPPHNPPRPVPPPSS